MAPLAVYPEVCPAQDQDLTHRESLPGQNSPTEVLTRCSSFAFLPWCPHSVGGKLRLASCSLQSAKPELLNRVIERQTSKFKDTISVIKGPQEIINVLSLEFSGKDCKPSSQECCERAFKTRWGSSIGISKTASNTMILWKQLNWYSGLLLCKSSSIQYKSWPTIMLGEYSLDCYSFR